MACTYCRSKHRKCDKSGSTDDPCSLCLEHGMLCSPDLPTRPLNAITGPVPITRLLTARDAAMMRPSLNTPPYETTRQEEGEGDEHRALSLAPSRSEPAVPSLQNCRYETARFMRTYSFLGCPYFTLISILI